jgi:DNA-binding LacI/PurR family transcriptional regulator
LLPSFAHRFLGELSDEIFHCLNEQGYSAIFGVGKVEKDQSNLIDSMVSRKVDGIISYYTDSKKLIGLNENGIPVVVYRRPNNYPLSYVDVDRFEGGKLLANHFIASGRKRIAFIGGIDKSQNPDRRFAGYQAAMFENNLEIDESLIVDISGEMEEGIKGIRILLEKSKQNLPDAVMFHNDSMAIGGMGEAQRHGIRVPEDMAVAGFDNIEESKYCVPKLTTIKQPKKQIAAKLVEMLVKQIKSPNSHIAQNYIFAPEIIIRESSGQTKHRNEK